MIYYTPFWETLKDRNITTYRLTKYHGISQSTFARMRKNKGISTETINTLCGILKCRVEDILVYVDEEE